MMLEHDQYSSTGLRGITGWAEFTKCRTYRLRLGRIWSDLTPDVLWIMLNPSKANETVDDPTIKKCIGFTERWGYGGIVVVNLFQLVETDSKRLFAGLDPLGPEATSRILREAETAGRIICAWGSHSDRRVLTRARAVTELLEQAGASTYCLGRTKDGSPRHPGRIAYSSPMVRFGVAA